MASVSAQRYTAAVNLIRMRLSFSGILLGACLLCVSAAGSQVATRLGGRLTGRVLDETGAVVYGANVTLFSDDRVRTTKADDNGEFAFATLPSGARYLEVSSPGFIAGFLYITAKTRQQVLFNLRVGSGGGPYVTCDEGKIVPPSASYEEQSGKVRLAGTVGDAWGGTLAGTTVTLIQTAPDAPPVTKQANFGGSTMQVSSPKETIIAEVIPNEKGEFQFSDLEPGWYTLKATHDGYWDGRWGDGTRFWIARENLTKLSRIYLFTKSVPSACGTRWDGTGTVPVMLQH